MRLFVAIDLGDDAKHAIIDLQQRVIRGLGEKGRSLRPVRGDQLHLTLAFLGEVADTAASALVAAFSVPVGQSSFGIEFCGLGMFPPRGAPHVLWVGIRRGVNETLVVHRETAARIAAQGIQFETRPFSPHLTIGRWRDARPADRERALALDDGAVVASIQVTSIALYRSELRSEGALHTVLARATLG